MPTVDINEARSNLSRLVTELESGAQTEIIITRNGRPAARLVTVNRSLPGKRIGVAEGEFTAPEDIDVDNAAIADLLTGRSY